MQRRLLTYSFSLLNVDFVHLDNRWNYKNVISPYYRLYYIAEGFGAISTATMQHVLEPGYIYLIPSFTMCTLSCNEKMSQYFIQFFEDSADSISLFNANREIMKIPAEKRDVENFKRLLAINPGRGINRSDNPKVYEKDIYYKQYQELNNLQSLSIYLETQGIIIQLLAGFLTPLTFKHKISTTIPSKILDTIGYIQLNLAKDLTVSLLAARVNQHPDYFSRAFLNSTGIRPIKFILDKRVERAQYLITTMNLPYEVIAEEIGFTNIPYFFKIFKRITGLTPGEYRKQHHMINEII